MISITDDETIGNITHLFLLGQLLCIFYMHTRYMSTNWLAHTRAITFGDLKSEQSWDSLLFSVDALDNNQLTLNSE